MIVFLLLQIFLVIISLIFNKLPPSSPNWVYGYRSKKSRSSQEAWEYAQKLSGKSLLIISCAFLILFIVLTIIDKFVEINLNYIEYAFLIEVVIVLLSCIYVEYKLRKNF